MDLKKLLEKKSSCTHCGSKNYDVNSVDEKDIIINSDSILFQGVSCDNCAAYFEIKVEYKIL